MPEVEVSADLAKCLIEKHFAELAGVSVEPFARGWDNVAYRVDGRLIFRFPQRRVAVPLIEVEVALLPWLAPRLPFAVTAPTHVARPVGDYAFPFAGYPELRGTTACRAVLDVAARRALGAPLGRALRALHGIDVGAAAAAGAPPDRLGRADVDRYMGLGRDRMVGALSGPHAELAGRALRVLDDTYGDVAPRGGGTERRLVHGDLYARHVIVRDGVFVGLIDWGDVHLGDPALDLGVAHALLPPDAHATFRAAYGPISAAAWSRARFRAAFYVTALLAYGWDAGDVALLDEATTALGFLEA